MLPIHDENECESVPYVNNCLIAINIIVLGVQVYLFGVAVLFGITDDSYCLVPTRFLHHFDAAEALTLLTAMFSHAGLGHLIGNLWVLYLFGDNVEDKIGHRNYLLFYLGCGVIAAMAHIISDPTSSVGCLGASGAIAGVMAAYLILFPSVPVKTWIAWFWCINIPAWLIIGGWFGIQLVATAVFMWLTLRTLVVSRPVLPSFNCSQSRRASIMQKMQSISAMVTATIFSSSRWTKTPAF